MEGNVRLASVLGIVLMVASLTLASEKLPRVSLVQVKDKSFTLMPDGLIQCDKFDESPDCGLFNSIRATLQAFDWSAIKQAKDSFYDKKVKEFGGVPQHPLSGWSYRSTNLQDQFGGLWIIFFEPDFGAAGTETSLKVDQTLIPGFPGYRFYSQKMEPLNESQWQSARAMVGKSNFSGFQDWLKRQIPAW